MVRIFILFFFANSYNLSQQINIGFASKLKKNTDIPFWIASNKDGTQSNYPLINFNIYKENNNFNIGFNAWSSLKNPDKILLSNNYISLKNNIVIRYDIKKELRIKSQETIARFLKKTIEKHYNKIKHIDLKFDIPTLKKDMESKTSTLLSKTFSK